MRVALTILVWIATLACLSIAAAVAALFVFIATSLDPAQMITAGTDPWVNAILAVLGFLGIALLAALGLKLWHSARLWPVGLVFVALQVAGVVWACLLVYNEYV